MSRIVVHLPAGDAGHHDLDDLAGGWSERDEAESIAPLGEIDESLRR